MSGQAGRLEAVSSGRACHFSPRLGSMVNDNDGFSTALSEFFSAEAHSFVDFANSPVLYFFLSPF